FTGQFRSRYESSNVRAPIRNSRQAGVDRNRHVSAQCLPSGLHVSGPKEGSITLHSRSSVSMECEWTLVRTPQLRSFPIHLVPVAARRFVETITLIGPPPIDSGIEDGAVRGPVAANHEIFFIRRRTGAIYSPDQTAAFRFDDDMQDDSEVLVVEFTDRLLRIRKICWMPRELSIPRVPTGGSEAGAQINQRIAR